MSGQRPNEPLGEQPLMADYGVGGPEWQALPWAWASERLAANRNYWVVTVGPDSQPHSMPVWGVWHDAEQRFMFSCSPNARKARDLEHNQRVTFTTSDTVECVSVQGIAHRITDTTVVRRWAKRYEAKYSEVAGDDGDDGGGGSGSGEDMAEFVASHACFEVAPSVAFAIIERADEFASRATRWRLDG